MASARRIVTCWAWPGLRQLWVGGSSAGLALAVGSAALLNLLLLAGFVWTEWVSPATRSAGWLAVLGIWSAAAIGSWYSERRERRRFAQATSAAEAGHADPLAEAIDEYLKGKWYETEMVLRRLLRRNRRDVEALLMMASLCRHSGRLEEAGRRLGDLTSLESAQQWHIEIEHERQLLLNRNNRDQQAAQQPASPPGEPAPAAPEMTRAA